MTYTAVIRQRGQLTIPDKVREALDWMRVGEVVGLEVSGEQVMIKPHVKTTQKKIDWDNLWRKIELARSFKGERGNLSQMIIEDRETH